MTLVRQVPPRGLGKKKLRAWRRIESAGIDPSQFQQSRLGAIAKDLEDDVLPESVAESDPEEILQEKLNEADIKYTAQKWITISRTRRIRVDFFIEPNIIIEVDGYAYHGGKEQWHKDRLRDNALAIMGYIVLRYPARNIYSNPYIVLGDLKRLKVGT